MSNANLPDRDRVRACKGRLDEVRSTPFDGEAIPRDGDPFAPMQCASGVAVDAARL